MRRMRHVCQIGALVCIPWVSRCGELPVRNSPVSRQSSRRLEIRSSNRSGNLIKA
jgi:hypothetical protein